MKKQTRNRMNGAHVDTAHWRAGRQFRSAGGWMCSGLAAFGFFLVIGMTLRAGGAEPAVPGSTTQPAAPPDQATTDDLRSLLGVNPEGRKRVDVPQVPNMTLRGFVQPVNGQAIALLELTDLKQLVLVHEGTEIPITVSGHLSPAGRSELQGLDDGSRAPGAANAGGNTGPEQSQIILKVIRVSDEGVTVTAGLERQTIVIR